MQLVYKLDFPDVNEFFTEEFRNKLFNTNDIINSDTTTQTRNEYVSYQDASGMIEPAYRTYGPFVFNVLEVFLKSNGTRGFLHRDSKDDTKFPWGINWIVNGTGIMEYYDPLTLTINNTPITKGRYTRNYTSPHGIGLTPVARYELPPGVYLVNADMPHVPSGTDQRIAISVRSTRDYTMTWDTVCNHFKNRITPVINTLKE